ncbi:phosphotransferase [Brevibacillus composti]|uniref:Phosphotransferase n=1 Tax=Brevibacillus composti TaxID=2796470 RepID=A0A7T5EIP5_9BACL|nr:phosphotransferase [Brevibacillus composti]QQE73308.1 phosphotransferase [Brevibacillus composti]QUO40389.1 phosphotransferase [Brevibacillus composti]
MEQINLSELCQRYRARVIHITPLEDCYLLETNRGPKELHIWPRADVMRWSFFWRESMARQGFRQLERFIRTRDAKPYVMMGQRGITLTDHQRHIEAVTPTVELARQCGEIVAMMHAAQRESRQFHAADYWERAQGKAASEVKRAEDFLGTLRFRGRPSARRYEAVSWLFPPLLERMRRCASLLQSARIDHADLFVTHGRISRDNWVMVRDKLFLHGFFKPKLSVAQRDVAGYLRELYLVHEDLAQIDAFLDGYEEIRPLSQSEYTLLVAFMGFPLEVWRELQAVFRLNGEPEEERLARLEQAVHQQQAVDQLIGHIAERAEGMRSESKA